MPERHRLRTARPLTRDELALKYPISIVIPVRDSSDFLASCLEALGKNRLTNTEICVVDDASTESITQVVSRAQLPVSPIVHRLETSRGPAGARNAGLEATSLPYVFFLDADVMLPSESLDYVRESLHLYSHRPKVIGVLGSYAEDIPHKDFWSNYKNLSTSYLYAITDPVTPFLHTPMFCVRREVLVENGGFQEDRRTAEDFRLAIQLGTQGFRSVIDRRIRGIHLKPYDLAGVLREDRQRVRDMAALQLSRTEKDFSYRAHRVNRILSVLLPMPLIVLLLLSAFNPLFLKSAVLLAGTFLVANAGFLKYVAKRRGRLFALRSIGVLFGEMLWAQACLLASFAKPGRGR